MAYSTKSDILDQLDEVSLIQLTDDVGTGAVDDEKVEKAISAADAKINAYCQNRYSIPLTPVTGVIVDMSVDIAIYRLYSRRADTIPEIRKDNYKDAIRFLERVSDGKVELGSNAVEPAGEGEYSGESLISTKDKEFGTETMDKY